MRHFRQVWNGSEPPSLFRRSRLLALAVAVLLASASALSAQQTESKKAAPAKADNAKQTGGTPATTDTKPPVGDGDRLSFDQSKVAAEMNELEERMFRLSEALKQLEPENSSRLMIALKNAREELILHQMKETQELLKKLELSSALTEEKQLLAKLQRLHELLMSMDLDFQRLLERLRLIRDIIRQLDKAIKEEDREQKLSREAAKTETQVAELRQRLATLEELIKRQTGHVEEGKRLAKLDRIETEGRKSLGQLAEGQQVTRGDTKSLAEAIAKSGAESENLGNAETQMGQATDSLKKEAAADAVPRQEEALDSLKKELGRTVEELKRREQQLAKEKFDEMRQDQEGNRKATEGITDSARKLGDSGANAVGALVRGTGSMSGAEDDLGNRKPDPASERQDDALKSLKYARDELAREEAELLESLRAEVRRRVLEALTIMLEKQIAVRESTETLQPRVKSGSREAVTSVVGLSKAEGRIIELASEAVTLVEETEFGIALPAALRVVRRSMTGVKNYLGKGDASPPVVTAEKEIESDLKALLDAMKQMPSSRMSNNRAQRGQRDRERELNRIIAELKMIRLLQIRVNSETLDVDGKRPDEDVELAAAIKKAIASVEDHQDEVREATIRLAEERSDDLQQ